MIRVFSPLNVAMLTAIGLAFGYGWFNIPLDKQVAVHWDIFGQPDSLMAASYALLIAPIGASLIVIGAMAYNARISQNEQAAGKSLVNASVTIAFAAMCFAQLMIVIQASGPGLDITRFGTLFVGFVLLIIGNYLPKSQRNKWSGIRTKWTLSSEDNWTKTHQFAGRIFMLAGLAAVLVGVIGIPAPYNLGIAIFCLAASTIASIAYSYLIRESAGAE
ncbi:SdpI family protein [Maritalea sp.]|uniref:SdpI family protein n=1 Tax=Maritalea sp. TaxID=2003361 RepID=UPI003EF7892E